MSQVQITGRIVAAQPLFDNGSFRKQTLIIEVVNGTYQSFFPVDFIQGDIDTLLPQVQMHGTYLFTAWVQGSKTQMTDRNGQPTAYVNLKISAVAPAQPQAQAPTAQPAAFGGQAAPQGFGQPAPAQQQQGFGQSQAPQGGIGQPQQFGGQSAQTQPAQGFGQPAAQPAQQFGQPQTQQAPPAFNPNAGQ